MPERSEEPLQTLEHLARAADPGLVAMAGPRYFGFVIGGTTWHGVAAMRISVSNWSTTEGDVERSVAAILRAAR